MPGAAGFANYTVSPSPDPRMVGQAITQAPQQPGPVAPPMARPALPDFGAEQMAIAVEAEQARLHGALLSSGRAGGGEDSAKLSAVGDALTRMGGGHTASQNASKPRANNKRQLMQLGLDEDEADLLLASGGV